VRKSKSKEYFFCSSRRHEVNGREPCTYSKITHRADRVDPAVWNAVRDVVTKPDILRAAIVGKPDMSADGYLEEYARCKQLLQRLVDAETTITRAFRRGELSAEAWRSQLREINSDRHILEESRDLAKQQIEAADAVSSSLDNIEAQISDLRTRVHKANEENRKAIVAALVPDYQPFGIVVWPDGEIAVRGAIPASPSVVKREPLVAQDP